MKTKHTPGSWKFKANYNEIFVYSEIHGAICESSEFLAHADEHKANAKLIAAAPELLESLKELMDEVQKQCPIGSDPIFMPMLEKWQSANKAIKKATE